VKPRDAKPAGVQVNRARRRDASGFGPRALTGGEAGWQVQWLVSGHTNSVSQDIGIGCAPDCRRVSKARLVITAIIVERRRQSGASRHEYREPSCRPRVPFADGTLVKVPGTPDVQLYRHLLTLTDVLASKRLGAARIIMLSRHEDPTSSRRATGSRRTRITTCREWCARPAERREGSACDFRPSLRRAPPSEDGLVCLTPGVISLDVGGEMVEPVRHDARQLPPG
jgi:hypothetical protein